MLLARVVGEGVHVADDEAYCMSLEEEGCRLGAV